MPAQDRGKGAAGRRWGRVALVVALGVTAATAVALWWGGRADDPSPAPAGPPGPTAAPSPTLPADYPLEVELGRVDPVAVSDRIDRVEVGAAARAVRDTLTGLYRTGFVDTAAWERGRFTGLAGYFTPTARPQARRDVRHLTLGSAATRLAQVRPDRARVRVRVLVGAEGRPISAIAGMEFRATGLGAETGEVRIRHGGRYVLRPQSGRWLVVAYDVLGRVGGGR
jgi:hypothetical protein